MRLLTDHDVFAVTVRALREWGHDVSTAALLGLAQHTDDDLLTAARDAGRVLITRDKDFGSLVFLRRPDSLGVILLRVSPVTLAGVHVQLRGLLEGSETRPSRARSASSRVTGTGSAGRGDGSLLPGSQHRSPS